MGLSRFLLVVCGISALVLSCTRQKDTFSGNAEAYSGLRPRDGQYVWFDSRVSCTKDGVTETGYRGVLTVAGNAPIKYREACSAAGNESIVLLKDLDVIELKEPGIATQNILRFQQGIYDPSSDVATPPPSGTTRTVATFEVGNVDYEIAVRASGPIESLVDARALITSKVENAGVVTTTLLATVPVTSPTSTTDTRTYTGTDFNLTVTKSGGSENKNDVPAVLTATFSGKIDGVSTNLTTNNCANTFLTPPPAKRAWLVAAGSNFTCVTDQNEIFCTGGIVASHTFVRIHTPAGGVSSLTAGTDHACAIVNSKAYCWGSNISGQLGYAPSTQPKLTPFAPPNLPNLVIKIAAGRGHTCAIARSATGPTDNNALYCWGDNMQGQLGRPAVASALPDIVPGLNAISVGEVALGDKHTCFKPDPLAPANVQCFGDNSEGQLGNNTTTTGHTPVATDTQTKFVALYAAGNSTCAMTTIGQLYCWGSNAWGVPSAGNHMAHGADIPILKPLNISSYINANIQRFAMSAVHACAIITVPGTYKVMCWGWTDGGATQGPYGGAKAAYIANELPVTSTNLAYTGISAGASAAMDGKMHTMLFDDTKFVAQGFNSAGQLGDGTTTNRIQTPAVVTPPK